VYAYKAPIILGHPDHALPGPECGAGLPYALSVRVHELWGLMKLLPAPLDVFLVTRMQLVLFAISAIEKPEFWTM
jgi:hypothetical protein